MLCTTEEEQTSYKSYTSKNVMLSGWSDVKIQKSRLNMKLNRVCRNCTTNKNLKTWHLDFWGVQFPSLKPKQPKYFKPIFQPRFLYAACINRALWTWRLAKLNYIANPKKKETFECWQTAGHVASVQRWTTYSVIPRAQPLTKAITLPVPGRRLRSVTIHWASATRKHA